MIVHDGICEAIMSLVIWAKDASDLRHHSVSTMSHMTFTPISETVHDQIFRFCIDISLGITTIHVECY